MIRVFHRPTKLLLQEQQAESVYRQSEFVLSMRTEKLWAVLIVLSAVVGVSLAIACWRGDLRDVRERLDKANRHVHSGLNELIRHVKGPWNPSSKDMSVYGAPFDAVRWRDSVPEVRVRDTWYELLSLNDVPVEAIVSFSKEAYGRIWRKRFEEDLVMVLDRMGIRHHFDSETKTGSLTVRQLDTGKTMVLTNVPWSSANRMTILGKALEVQKANEGNDLRDDPSFR